MRSILVPALIICFTFSVQAQKQQAGISVVTGLSHRYYRGDIRYSSSTDFAVKPGIGINLDYRRDISPRLHWGLSFGYINVGEIEKHPNAFNIPEWWYNDVTHYTYEFNYNYLSLQANISYDVWKHAKGKLLTSLGFDNCFYLHNKIRETIYYRDGQTKNYESSEKAPDVLRIYMPGVTIAVNHEWKLPGDFLFHAGLAYTQFLASPVKDREVKRYYWLGGIDLGIAMRF